MKRLPLFILLLIFSLTLTTFHVDAITTNTKTTTPSSVDYKIEKVDHVVQLTDGGLVIINDTVKLSLTGGSSGPLHNFSIGFPIQFQSDLDYCFAHDSLHRKLDVELDVGLGRLGFYGINLNFPGEGVSPITDVSHTFTVVFAFSNLISPKNELVPEELVAEEPITYRNETLFYVDFPMYPSLTQNASLCNVTITIPDHVYVSNSSRGDWLGARGVLNHEERNLTAFAYEEPVVFRTSVPFHEPPVTYEEKAQLKLGIDIDAPSDAFSVIGVKEIKRYIRLDEWGQILLFDTYHITDKAGNLSFVKIRLPIGAYDVSYYSERGGYPTQPAELPNATIGFVTALEKGESTEFIVTYRLRWTEYVTQSTWRSFGLAFSFFERQYLYWTMGKLSVTVYLPEGAKFQSCSVPPQSVEESITFSFDNVTPFHDPDFHLTYEYVIFWASFYPTLWVGLSVIIVCIIGFLWRAPKPPPVPMVSLSPESLRGFVDTYERKTSAIRELEILEQQVRKRKLSRRRYKVRKKALEGRLSVLSKDLTDLREDIRKAGSRYANIMRQIEVAETEFDETEAAIRRIELRYRRREISKETYHRLLEEYTRRKERAETTIDGVLLRLREEIR